MENTGEIKRLGVRPDKQYEKVLASMVCYVFDLMQDCRDSMAQNKPSCNEREFKMFNRLLKQMIEENDRRMTYKLDDEHKAEVTRMKNELTERIAYSMQMLYFSVRNEVLNSGLPDDAIDPVVRIRILDVFLDSLSNVASDFGCSLRKEFASVSDVLKAFVHDWDDRGGHQKTCEVIIIKEVNQMFMCA